MNFVNWVAAAATALAITTLEARADTLAVSSACNAEQSPKLKEIKDRGVLRWALGISAPFAFKTTGGEYAGTEPDNAREFASILGVKLELRDYSYPLLPPSLVTGNADIVGAALYITDKRKEVIDFSKPYQKEGQIFVRLASRSDLDTIEHINRNSSKAISNAGSGQVDLTRKLLPHVQVITADLSNLSVQAQYLIGEQADVTMADAASFPLLKKAAAGVPLTMVGPNGIVLGDIPLAEDTIEPFDIGFGVAKGDSGFLSCVNAYVDDLTETGRFRKRYVQWIEKMAE